MLVTFYFQLTEYGGSTAFFIENLSSNNKDGVIESNMPTAFEKTSLLFITMTCKLGCFHFLRSTDCE